LVELAPKEQQRAPQGDMVGDGVGPADRAEIDGVAVREALFPVLGHHPSMARVVRTAGKVEMPPVEGDAESPAGGLEDPDALGHDLGADAVTGDYRDPQCTHRLIPRAPGARDRTARRSTAATGRALNDTGRHAAGIPTE